MSCPAPGTAVLVHGLGRFGGGREAIRFLVRHGCRVRVADRADGADLQDVRRSIGEGDRTPGAGTVDWQLGREDAGLLAGIELVVQNPAVPDDHPLIGAARARGIALTQELDLFLAAYPGRVVGVTGTNGKSTTATLLHRALRRAGIDALLGGNIGHSLLADEAQWRSDQIAVVEMSSFQLARLAPERAVHGAVFTRVTCDHLDRHGTLADYHAAKGRLAAAARRFVVHAAADEVAAAYPTGANTRRRFALTEPAPDCGGLVDGFLALRRGVAAAVRLAHRDAMLQGGSGFQLENALAAALAADSLGADEHNTGLALALASPLPFRLQQVATIRGVRVFDNAVSTALDSTVSALDTLALDAERGRPAARVHWVGGGKSKDGRFDEAARELAQRCATAHVFGAAAAPLAAHWPNAPTLTQSEHLDDALAAALGAATPGDVVLFSPGFASFDQYPNFRARGLAFHEWLGRASGTRAHATPSG